MFGHIAVQLSKRKSSRRETVRLGKDESVVKKSEKPD